jgi:hypothetical protein
MTDKYSKELLGNHLVKLLFLRVQLRSLSQFKHIGTEAPLSTKVHSHPLQL